MRNHKIDLGVVREVARGLGELKNEVIFVGGAIVSLYADDPAADEIRPTQDVDMTIEITNYVGWVDWEEKLREKGIFPDRERPNICSYKLGDIPLDIMPSEATGIGPANRWYAYGFEDNFWENIDEEAIRIFSAPCFLATKFEAFNSRGKDYRTSHDFEDIIFIIDNRTDLVQEIENCHPDVRKFLREELQKLMASPYADEYLEAQIHPLIVEERLPIIKEKIVRILTLK